MASFLQSLFGGAVPRLDPGTWDEVLTLPVFAGLSYAETERLRHLGQQLLADKSFSAAGGMTLNLAAATRIAAHAALPVLNLGYSGYAGWREIIVYPGEFVPDREIMDETGIVHHVRQPMSGEAWEGGPMVLSWQDVLDSGMGEGFNVVIHEFAHKLDMINGSVNGQPVLPAEISPETWRTGFSAAYADFCRRVDAGEETAIDPYASESPAEFFAVLSEYFFEAPDILARDFPALYPLLQQFYRQDPLARLEHAHHDPANP
jgi:hypothetical protein